MANIRESQITKEYFLGIISDFENDKYEGHPYDLAQELLDLREISEDDYEFICKKMPIELFAEILCEMPNYIQEEISDILSDNKIANITSKWIVMMQVCLFIIFHKIMKK